MELIDIVDELRKAGFEIEMDDFGSGYSSLNMLSSMPIDVLKMDMKFIRNLEADIRNFRMIELILDIAKFLEVPVVAEGVETEEQVKMLKDADCELVQGFYFSRPLPADEFKALIVKEKNTNRDQA
jgi:EAL domain-containing protein (putative c-di-GMP-specific phosphodiesterase class I)